MTLAEQLKQVAKMKASDRPFATVSVPLPQLLRLIDGVRPDQTVVEARKGLDHA